jgi:hypothetical protein
VVGEQLARAHEAVEVNLLRRNTDEQARRKVGDGVVAEDEDPSCRCAHEPSRRADQGRLTSAVGAEQTEEAACRDAQLKFVERACAVGVDLGQPLDE